MNYRGKMKLAHDFQSGNSGARLSDVRPRKANTFYNGDYGSWVTPSGRLYRVQEPEKHEAELPMVFRQEGIPVRGTPNYNSAFLHRFVRVTNKPLTFQIRSRLTPSQKDTLLDLVFETPYKDVFISTSDALDRLNKDEGIDEIEDKIRAASVRSRRAEVLHSGDYGSWIAPSGKVYRVVHVAEHEKVIEGVLKQEGIDAGKSNDLLSYEARERFGFVRVVNNPLSFNFQKHLTAAQKSTMEDLVMEYRGDIIRFDTEAVYKNYDKNEQMHRIEGFLRAASDRSPQLARELLKIARGMIKEQ